MIDPADVADLQLEDVEDYDTDYPPIGFPQADENIHTSGQPNKPGYRRSAIRVLLTKNKWATGLVAMFVLICIIMISVLASGGKSSSKSGSPTFDSSAKNQAPIMIDPESLDPAITEPLLESLLAAYVRSGLDATPLSKEAGDTPQRHAFYWMATDELLDHFDHTETMQRYAMAVLYYSTNAKPNFYIEEPDPWVDAANWLTEAHVCEWRGIECNHIHVESITLSDNNLSGSLPQELALCEGNLNFIDLSANMIYMEGSMYDIFKPLVKLETLLLDDNFMVYENGLPKQFKHLEKMQKLRMSYNLLAGQLETEGNEVLTHMGALTHLEIESNFLTGSMPSAIDQLTGLVYLYMRRNELTTNLNFLRGGRLVDLFALWLDSNTITGKIPSEIGLLQDLASISITNSTLTGSIPTEFGSLTGLRRLWLYSNLLTGDIPSQLADLAQLEVLEIHDNSIVGVVPEGICSKIAQSEYEFKALTADCNSEVSCAADCCTKCY